jgi:putative ABC transport system permease protein
MRELIQDLRFGIRMLAKKPGVVAAAILMLALGIGANTAIFSVVNAVLLRALPYRDAGRLAVLWEDASSFGFAENSPAPGNFTEWRKRNRSFEDIAAIRDAAFNLSGSGEPEQVLGNRVTSNLFSVLGVEPALGRAFSAEEDQPGHERVALLSHGLWVRRFGSDPKIAGRQIRIDGADYVVAGVMPRGFSFPSREAEIWVPFGYTAEQWANAGSHFLRVYGRLKDGVTLGQANADLAAIARALGEEHPDSNSKIEAYAVMLREQIVKDLRPGLLLLLGAAGFVLLIACANVANLFLARATARRREMALRMALGAGRGRILRQLLTESVVVSSVAGTLGCLCSLWGVTYLWRLIPEEIARPEGAGVDYRVLFFTVVISVGTGLVFGSAPGWRMSRLDLIQGLKEAGRGGVGSSGGRLREFLVGGEVALAVVLLTGAALFLESFAKLRGQDLGFRPDHVLVLRTALPRMKYAEARQKNAFFDGVLDRVTHLPGVTAAGYTTWVPLTNRGGASGITIEGQPEPKPGQMPIPNVRAVSKDYFSAMGFTLKAGRLFDERDGERTMSVAVINQTMARKWWPGEDPIGRRFKFGSYAGKDPWITIIGIVGDVRQMGVDQAPRAELYQPYQQQPNFAPSYLAVRTSGDPTKLAEVIRQKIWEVDSEQPVAGAGPMQDLIDEDLSPRMIQTSLLSSFAGLALLLAALGIYALLSFTVAQRTQEIGVRMALGAQPGDVFALVIVQGFKPLLAGISAGVAGALALHRVAGHMLYEVSATDPVTLTGVGVSLMVVALASCYFPARRAMRVDPMVALRYE